MSQHHRSTICRSTTFTRATEHALSRPLSAVSKSIAVKQRGMTEYFREIRPMLKILSFRGAVDRNCCGSGLKVKRSSERNVAYEGILTPTYLWTGEDR